MKTKYIILLLLIVFLINCSDNKKGGQQHVKNNRIQQDNQDNDIFWRDYNRVIGLLSTKYSFPDSIVKAMILEYLRINKPANYYSLTMNDKNRDTTIFDNIIKAKESIGSTIQRLNLQYGIRKDTISLLLFDFELWLQTK